MTRHLEDIKTESIELLKKMITTPSISRNEQAVADLLQEWFTKRGFLVNRSNNNIWIHQEICDSDKPVVLLNSHIDTVKPAAGYSCDPYLPTVENGRLYGLGSNDAGAPLVALIAAFRHLITVEQPYNLILAATAEEEVSGQNGVESILPQLPQINLAIVGEPTQMQMAVAEKGLMVLDCVAHGKAGHAARNEGDNAIYKALCDIEWFKKHKFDRISQFLGEVKMSVTQIEAGTQHNVVPDRCSFVVDVRVNELYQNNELLTLIKENVACDVKERSTRLNSSAIDTEHPIVQRGLSLGMTPFGSPTMSDQALMPFTSIKIGPGDSARSHSADEYIEINEIEQGIDKYIALLDNLKI